jgi:uncharacterized protein (TIGR03083 family)
MDWSWAGPPLDVRPLFPRERAELLTLLSALDPADWRQPTVCPGWRVHDIAAHLVHDYLRKLSGLRDGFGGPGPLAGEDLPDWLHRVNQEFVDAAARWSPRALVDLLAHLGPQLDELWAGLDLASIGEPVSWAAPAVPAPRWLDVGREYTEYWVHQQQIRDAVERPGANSAGFLGPVVDVFLRAVPYALRDAAPAPGTCVQLDIDGAGGGSWSVTRQDARWSIGPGRCADPAAAIGLAADTLWRVATRGITVPDAAQRTRFAGARDLGQAALALVSIIR